MPAFFGDFAPQKRRLSWIICSSEKRGFPHYDVLGSLHSHGALAKIRKKNSLNGSVEKICLGREGRVGRGCFERLKFMSLKILCLFNVCLVHTPV